MPAWETHPVADIDTSPLDDAKYVAPTTYRRDGRAVPAPSMGGPSRRRLGMHHRCRLREGEAAGPTPAIEVSPCDVGDGSPRARHACGTGRVVTDVAEYRQVRAAVVRKYRLLGPLLNAWSKVSGLFGSHASETAVAWSIDEVV